MNVIPHLFPGPLQTVVMPVCFCHSGASPAPGREKVSVPVTMSPALKSTLMRSRLRPLLRMVLRARRSLRLLFAGFFGLRRRSRLRRYLARHPVRRLHLGCGHNLLEGWFNTDRYPRTGESVHLNATHRFPIPDGVFDYIFSEHLIEHMTYPQGQRMLGECFRVLRDGGVIRVATPDMAFLIELYREEDSELHREYIRWVTDREVDAAPYRDRVFVINTFMHGFGHLFIYDARTLRTSLERTGFIDTRICALGESGEEDLRNLENVKRLPEGFLKLESIVIEGRKPVVEPR